MALGKILEENTTVGYYKRIEQYARTHASMKNKTNEKERFV